jgi:hypothetical protein
MTPVRLRINEDGRVQGLWSDAIDWTLLGRVSVHRASHVEFCQRRQTWFVRAAKPNGWFRRLLQRLLRRPCGEVLHWAPTRGQALAWEHAHYEPGGPGWSALESR